MLINTEETCKTCDASRMDPAAKVLRCHQGPPVPAVVVTALGRVEVLCQFPPVQPTEWCQQYNHQSVPQHFLGKDEA